jgi:ribosomal protein S12 methylthiotransferase accessory factor
MIAPDLPQQRPNAVGVTLTALGGRDELAAPARPAGPGVAVQVYGNQALLGPVAGPGPGGCPQCLARRWQAIRPAAVRDALETGRPAGAPEPVVNPFAVTALAALAPVAEPGRVYRLDTETLLLQQFPLIPDPDCPSCGARPAGPATDELAGRAAKPAPAAFRLRPLAEFDLPVAALANPVCGMLGPSVSRDLGSPGTAATAGMFGVRTGGRLYEIFWGGHSVNYRDSATIGLLEGLERQAGMALPDPGARVVASLAALRAAGTAAVDPVDCGLYSARLHELRPDVPPFTPDREIGWVPGRRLRDHAAVLVPEVLVHYYAAPPEQRFVQECSNGCASGSSLLEAVYFGLMELIERDAFLLAWYGRAALPELDPASSADPEVAHLVARLELHGYRARFFDARTTFPIPVVVAAAVRADDDLGALCFGAGAGLDPLAALRSALVEIATDAPPLRRRTRGNLAELRAMAADFDLVRTVHDHPLLFGLPEMTRHADFLLDRPAQPPHALAELTAGTPRPSDDLAQDLAAVVALLAEQGIDPVAVDQTTPTQRAAGVHTAGVLAPGLLPIDFGWQRQRALRLPRMRTALRRAGLRDHDLEPADLNPVPHPFP